MYFDRNRLIIKETIIIQGGFAIQQPTSLQQRLLSRRGLPLLATGLVILLTVRLIHLLQVREELTIPHTPVPVYTESNTQSTQLTQLKEKQTVIVLSDSDGWYHIRYQGQNEGYIPHYSLSNPTLANDAPAAVETHIDTPFYRTLEANEESAGSLPDHQLFVLNYIVDNWCAVDDRGETIYLPIDQVELLTQEEYQTQLAAQESQQRQQETQDYLNQLVFARHEEEAILEDASLTAPLIGLTELNQEFKLLEVVYNEEEDAEFFHVEDLQGNQGYVEARIAAREINSVNHVFGPRVPSLQEATIVIDPGHGGEDPGALSPDTQAMEKEYTFLTAQKLKAALEAQGATVIMTRDSDVYVELQDRAVISEANDADVFLSLHFDSEADPDWSGVLTYYYHLADLNLAESISHSLNALPINNHGIRFGDYHVLRENDQPSLLLELGYMSNEGDRQLIRDDHYHDQIATALVQGLIDYFALFES